MTQDWRPTFYKVLTIVMAVVWAIGGRVESLVLACTFLIVAKLEERRNGSV